MKCPYCDKSAKLVTGDSIYPRRPDLRHKLFYLCRPCDAYVGCHEGGSRPLGRMANAELRRAKMAVHAVFDPLWQSGERKRKQAYHWLALTLGLTRAECHVGNFDLEQCRAALKFCSHPELSPIYLPSRSDLIKHQQAEQEEVTARFERAISS